LLIFCKNAKMQATLTLNQRGVITLPAKLRQALGLKADDQLIAQTTAEGLLLRPAITLPIEIYSKQRVAEFDQAEADLAKVLAARGVGATSAARKRRKNASTK
jgi:antitoxin PrlF